MSTRSFIARQTSTKKGDGFKGRYHHNDGYPSGVGATLFELYNGHFKRDIKAMLKFLIDDHPAGWSSINNTDFNSPAGFNENGFRTNGPHCYCHGGRKESAQLITEKNASSCGCEYGYIFNNTTMYVVSSFYKSDGSKMIGMFGCGADSDDVRWKIIGTVDLNAAEPDWEKFQ